MSRARSPASTVARRVHEPTSAMRLAPPGSSRSSPSRCSSARSWSCPSCCPMLAGRDRELLHRHQQRPDAALGRRGVDALQRARSSSRSASRSPASRATLVLGVPDRLCAGAQRRAARTRLFEELLVLPVAVPGLATALALILLYGELARASARAGCSSSSATSLFTLPFMVRSVLAVMAAIDLAHARGSRGEPRRRLSRSASSA